MNDEHHLYAQNARDHAETAEYWARKSRHYANSIDLPGAMLFAIAISLLITCVLIQLTGAVNHACQR